MLPLSDCTKPTSSLAEMNHATHTSGRKGSLKQSLQLPFYSDTETEPPCAKVTCPGSHIFTVGECVQGHTYLQLESVSGVTHIYS